MKAPDVILEKDGTSILDNHKEFSKEQKITKIIFKKKGR